MNNDPQKTALWMTREGVMGTPEEIGRYARDWLDVRESTGVALGLQRVFIPTRQAMVNRAHRIVREKTRTRVTNGYRVYVQRRDRMVFGRSECPGVVISVKPTDEPNTTVWRVVMSGDADYDLELTRRAFRIPNGAGMWEQWLGQRIAETIGAAQ